MNTSGADRLNRNQGDIRHDKSEPRSSATDRSRAQFLASYMIREIFDNASRYPGRNKASPCNLGADREANVFQGWSLTRIHRRERRQTAGGLKAEVAALSHRNIAWLSERRRMNLEYIEWGTEDLIRGKDSLKGENRKTRPNFRALYPQNAPDGCL